MDTTIQKNLENKHLNINSQLISVQCEDDSYIDQLYSDSVPYW